MTSASLLIPIRYIISYTVDYIAFLFYSYFALFWSTIYQYVPNLVTILIRKLSEKAA